MPSSTTLKLPSELKDRVADAAQASGQSPHAFMVEAIEAQTRLAERRRELANSLGVSVAEIERRGEELHEVNPMMGHRGVRLGITDDWG